LGDLVVFAARNIMTDSDRHFDDKDTKKLEIKQKKKKIKKIKKIMTLLK